VCADGQPKLDLPGCLVDVDHGDVDWQKLLLWDRQGDAEEGVEGLALPPAGGAGQRRVELRLEHVHDEAANVTNIVVEPCPFPDCDEDKRKNNNLSQNRDLN